MIEIEIFVFSFVLNNIEKIYFLNISRKLVKLIKIYLNIVLLSIYIYVRKIESIHLESFIKIADLKKCIIRREGNFSVPFLPTKFY